MQLQRNTKTAPTFSLGRIKKFYPKSTVLCFSFLFGFLHNLLKIEKHFMLPETGPEFQETVTLNKWNKEKWPKYQVARMASCVGEGG